MRLRRLQRWSRPSQARRTSESRPLALACFRLTLYAAESCEDRFRLLFFLLVEEAVLASPSLRWTGSLLPLLLPTRSVASVDSSPTLCTMTSTVLPDLCFLDSTHAGETSDGPRFTTLSTERKRGGLALLLRDLVRAHGDERGEEPSRCGLWSSVLPCLSNSILPPTGFTGTVHSNFRRRASKTLLAERSWLSTLLVLPGVPSRELCLSRGGGTSLSSLVLSGERWRGLRPSVQRPFISLPSSYFCWCSSIAGLFLVACLTGLALPLFCWRKPE